MKLPIAIIISSIIIVACASIEFKPPSEIENEQKNNSGQIVFVINRPNTAESTSSYKVVLSGMQYTDSISKENNRDSFHFKNLSSGNYDIQVYQFRGGRKVTTIKNISVDKDSISYVGASIPFSSKMDEDWKGVKVNASDTSLTGAIHGNFLKNYQQYYDYINSDEALIISSDLRFHDKHKNKMLNFLINPTDSFTIDEIPVGFYTCYIIIRSEEKFRLIESAKIYHVVIKPNKIAEVDFGLFHNPSEFSVIDELLPTLPHIVWKPNYR